jgi:DNA-binding MarR family transcriptional regulator
MSRRFRFTGEQVLEVLGIDQEAESVYLALVQHPDLGVSDIAAKLRISEDQARQALDRLSALTLVRTDDSRLSLVEPDVSLSLLLARQAAEVARRQQALAEARAAVAALSSTCAAATNRTGDNGIVELRGLDEVRARLETLSLNAESECMSFVPGGPQKSDTMEASKPLDQQVGLSGQLPERPGNAALRTVAERDRRRDT